MTYCKMFIETCSTFYTLAPITLACTITFNFNILYYLSGSTIYCSLTSGSHEAKVTDIILDKGGLLSTHNW